jgi:hypothetical protein
MKTFLISSSSTLTSPSGDTVVISFFISTYNGAEYVKFRSRASLGNKVVEYPSASVTIGLLK